MGARALQAQETQGTERRGRVVLLEAGGGELTRKMPEAVDVDHMEVRDTDARLPRCAHRRPHFKSNPRTREACEPEINASHQRSADGKACSAEGKDGDARARRGAHARQIEATCAGPP